MRQLFAIAALIGCITFSFSQTTYITANNNPGAPGGVNVYPTLQAAIDTAKDGDVIYVIPSSISYGDVVVDKGITLIGVGFNPNKAVGTRSTVGDITLKDASASNTRIAGIVSPDQIIIGQSSGTYSITNIIVENCRFARIVQNFASSFIGNLIIRNNIFTGTGFSGEARCIYMHPSASGVIITNNIIYGPTTALISGTGLTVENNLFFGDQSVIPYGNVHDCTFRKNIFYGVDYAMIDNNSSFSGNAFEDNLGGNDPSTLSFGTEINGNTLTNNLDDTDPLFTNAVYQSTWSDSFDFTLQAGSPAIVDISDATLNIGPSGGATPFNPEGTLLPLIENLTAPAIVKQGENLEIRIQASGN